MVYMVYGNHLCLARQSHTTDKYATWPKFNFSNFKTLGRKLATGILMVENAEKLKWNVAAKGGEGVLELALSRKDPCELYVFRNLGTLS